MRLTKQQRRIAYAAATSPYRPSLACVRLWKGRVIAVDGFVLAEAKLELEQEGEQFPDILIPARSFKLMEDLTVEDSIETAGEYPDTDGLYPAEKPVFSIHLNTKFLGKMLKVCGSDTEVKLTFYDKTRPVKFNTKNEEVKGLVMPLLTDW